MNATGSHRAWERKPLNISVIGRIRTRPMKVAVENVSEGGCRLRGKAGFARVGETVSLKIEGISTPMGRVVWVESTLAGVAFDGTLHPAVLDFLCNAAEAA